MSVITDVVVITSDGEDEAIAFVNAQMTPTDDPVGTHFGYYELRKVSDEARYGGGKVPSTEVWGGCFNYLPQPEFMDALKAAPWKFPHNVVAYIDYEAADGLDIWTPRDGYLREAGPA